MRATLIKAAQAIYTGFKSRCPSALTTLTAVLCLAWLALGREYARASEGLHEGFCYLVAITLLSCALAERGRRRLLLQQIEHTALANAAVDRNTAAIREYSVAIRHYTAESQVARGGIVEVPLAARHQA